MSLQDYQIAAPEKPFVGLENYRKLFNDPDFASSVLATFKFTVMFVPAVIVIALALAVMLNMIRHTSHFHVLGGHKNRLQSKFQDNVIDYRRVVRALHEAGYTGYICVEYVWDRMRRLQRGRQPVGDDPDARSAAVG